jgi:hypothetical protein
MKKILLSLIILFASACLFAQTAKNPFEKYGYKKQVMFTSSKGEFEEFHDQTDIVEIGSVLFDTKQNKVTGFVDEQKEQTNVSSFVAAMSIDPLCEKYYWISPYAYCMNNPVKFIDPDGRDGMVTGSGTKEDPYIITANYYYQKGTLNDEQVKGLNSAVSAYNNSGDKKGLTEIKNSDGSKSYVRYNLSAEGVDNVDEARLGTAFETTSGETRYYGNIVGTESNAGDEYGSANNIRIDFNVNNLTAGIESGMNSSSLNKGVAIHEIGHNLGGEHKDGTSVMAEGLTTITHNQIGNTTTVSYSYPSMSSKFTKIIFDRRNTPKANMGTGRLWTKKKP